MPRQTSPKHTTEDLDREEEAGVLRPNPLLVIGRQTAGGHDTVHVGMPDECLPPRVEDAEDADLCTEVARVGGDLTQRGRTRLKEPGVQLCGVAIAERQQRMRQREDDMHVRHVEELALPGGEPPGTRLRLTLRTVPIATRVIGDRPMPAGAALIDMAAERGGPTPGQRAEDGPLLHAEPRMLVEEVLTLRVEDIGHLHGGPAHDSVGFRLRRDRGTTGGGVTCSCSSGLGAAWRWRRERWRYTVVCDKSAWPSRS